MSASQITDLSKCCVHTITTKPWEIEESAKQFSAMGVKGISVWRETLHGRDIAKTGQMLRDSGLSIVSLARGGFFPHAQTADRRLAIDENKRAMDEAAALGAPHVVLVCGAVPGQPLVESREQIRDGIGELLDHAKAVNVKLAIEPLHPMYSDYRSAVNTLELANDMVEAINSPYVGIACDVYHLWWDPHLKEQLERCGKNKNIFAFHICDWKTPTIDILNDRGLMGEGCIPINQIRGWVEEAGFSGFNEVEIFSNIYWAGDQLEFLKQIKNAYLNHS